MLALLLAALAITSPQSTADPSLFNYDTAVPLDVRETNRREDNGVLLRDITYATLTGGTNAATVITPKVPPARPAPAILFVHWYGPPAPTSNRTQFIPDGVALARQGVTSLLIDTPWSDPAWFGTRKGEEDYTRSLQHSPGSIAHGLPTSAMILGRCMARSPPPPIPGSRISYSWPARHRSVTGFCIGQS
jgi:hypothetical protein